jgi:2-polyprenyl-3-methyl-5-hydroxy-6-metoxy-1,4-benzoquinol methylase
MSALSVEEVHAWVAAAHQRWAGGLEFRELRRGVQAVSDLYVHQRGRKSLSDRAADGRGKRAGFVLYYGGLHLLLVQEWLSKRSPVACETIWDLGCGPGVVGAAVARWSDCRRVVASDRMGKHLEVASWTGRQLGVKVITRKAELPGVVGELRGPGMITMGWVINELSDEARTATVHALVRRIRAGMGLLIFAPLSLRASPWWQKVFHCLRDARAEIHEEEFRCQPDLPPLIQDLDRATRLNHRTMGARVLYVPPSLKVPMAMA